MRVDLVRKALATRLREIPDLTVYERADVVPAVFPCCVIPTPDRVDYDVAARASLHQVVFEILFLTDRQTVDAQETIEQWLSVDGLRSVKSTLEDERTELGGGISNVNVEGAASQLYSVQRIEDPVLGCEITVTVWAGAPDDDEQPDS